VKLTTFSTDIKAHHPVVGRVRREYFPKENVPSTYVQISRLVEEDWLIEIEAFAILD
jgi:enamine deaminase RidA (YjgF/YER057c/UK114 family)